MFRTALNLVGRQPNTLQAIYDITEYLYIDNIHYKITGNKSSFFHAAASLSLSPNTVLINTCNIATYESLCQLNEKAVAASTCTMNVFNLLVFPHIYENSAYGIHNCNNIYLGMYYLDDTYAAKRNFIRSIIRMPR